MAPAVTKSSLSYASVMVGALVSLVAIGYFEYDKWAGGRPSNLSALALMLAVQLLPWMVMLRVAKSYGSMGFAVPVAIFAVTVISAWQFIDALILERDVSRVMVFLFVPAEQLVASVAIWIFAALLYRRSK